MVGLDLSAAVDHVNCNPSEKGYIPEHLCRKGQVNVPEHFVTLRSYSGVNIRDTG